MKKISMKRSVSTLLAVLLLLGIMPSASVFSASETIFSESFEGYTPYVNWIGMLDGSGNVLSTGTGVGAGEWTISGNTANGTVEVVNAASVDNTKTGSVLKVSNSAASDVFYLRRNSNQSMGIDFRNTVGYQGKKLIYQADVFAASNYGAAAETNLLSFNSDLANLKTAGGFSRISNSGSFTMSQGGWGTRDYTYENRIFARKTADIRGTWKTVTAVVDQSETQSKTRPDTVRWYIDGVLQSAPSIYNNGLEGGIKTTDGSDGNPTEYVYDFHSESFDKTANSPTNIGFGTFYGVVMGSNGGSASLMYFDNLKAYAADTFKIVSAAGASDFDPSEKLEVSFNQNVSENTLAADVVLKNSNGEKIENGIISLDIKQGDASVVEIKINPAVVSSGRTYKLEFLPTFYAEDFQGLQAYKDNSLSITIADNSVNILFNESFKDYQKNTEWVGAVPDGWTVSGSTGSVQVIASDINIASADGGMVKLIAGSEELYLRRNSNGSSGIDFRGNNIHKGKKLVYEASVFVPGSFASGGEGRFLGFSNNYSNPRDVGNFSRISGSGELIMSQGQWGTRGNAYENRIFARKTISIKGGTWKKIVAVVDQTEAVTNARPDTIRWYIDGDLQKAPYTFSGTSGYPEEYVYDFHSENFNKEGTSNAGFGSFIGIVISAAAGTTPIIYLDSLKAYTVDKFEITPVRTGANTLSISSVTKLSDSAVNYLKLCDENGILVPNSIESAILSGDGYSLDITINDNVIEEMSDYTLELLPEFGDIYGQGLKIDYSLMNPNKNYKIQLSDIKEIIAHISNTPIADIQANSVSTTVKIENVSGSPVDFLCTMAVYGNNEELLDIAYVSQKNFAAGAETSEIPLSVSGVAQSSVKLVKIFLWDSEIGMTPYQDNEIIFDGR